MEGGLAVERIRLLIAHEQPEERVRLRGLLEAAGGDDVEVVAQAASGDEAVTLTGAISPDIVLLDIALTDANPGQFTQTVRQHFPTTSVVLLSSRPNEEELFQAIRYGAAAYVSRDTPARDLISTVRRVRSGKYVIDDNVLNNPSLATRVLSAFRELAAMDHNVKPLFVPLSAREIEVLENAARGSSNKQIARAMSISEQTVKNHLTSIMRKLAVNDRTHAVVYALRHGWIKVPDI